MNIQQLYSHFLECTGVSTDTRKINQGTMFFALKGDNFDANTFAQEALLKGANYVVIDNPACKSDDKMILVTNTLEALQEMAKHHRRTLGLPVIALTGSNGKTTSKELINAVLSQKYTTSATVGNLNNHIGVPLTLLSFTKDTEIGIVEMGANHQTEIAFLCNIAEPNFGYITNFGKAHLEGFGGYEGVIKGKSELYDYLAANTKMAFVNLDDDIQKEKTKNIPRYTFAVNDYNCDVRIETVNANPMVSLKYSGIDVNSHLIGLYNASNISAAIAIGHHFKVSDNKIKSGIEGYHPENNRSQLLTKGSYNIILDAYNANPSSMLAAIKNFVNLETDNEKIAVLGDMFELGPESHEEHHQVVNLLKDHGDVTVYFIGKDFYSNTTKDNHLHFFESFESFKESFITEKPHTATVLIKGSRGMSLERTLELL